ncbi:MAG: glycogen/starch synthase [Thermoanaerobaculia bacterium]
MDGTALLRRTRTVLTVHNIGYQGVLPLSVLPELGLEGEVDQLRSEDRAAGAIVSAAGILHAEVVTTVSPTHAREIQTPEYGMGLEGLVRSRADRLVGILNGVDYAEWDPSSDPMISFHFDRDDLSGKEKNKRVLLEGLGLPYGGEVPALGIVSRLVHQKGIDLMLDPLPRFLERRDLRLVALGSGEPRYENYFQWLQLRFPEKVVYYRGFQNELAHLIEAGADVFLMPSLYEPCGLNQMYSLRYGTVPVVRRTGGLADTVEPWNPGTGDGTGFLFDHATPEGFAWALGRALDAWPDRERWRRLRTNGMAMDWSWERQGGLYVELYRKLASGAL